MQYSASAGPRKSFELPRDEGLAEWTSRIKAMQRQVDADEETEQKKLEQEIAASRLARQRRTRGFGYGGQASSTDELGDGGYPSGQEKDSSHDDSVNRYKRQEALSKLSGVPSYGPSGASSLTRSVAPPMQNKSPSLPPENRSSEPMSLAAFMGGRATGPRLNKHAPQQDAHDPTQFEQRTHISAPHPVFGRGGIAMPGLASISKTSPSVDSRTSQPSDRVDKAPWSTPKRPSTTETVSSTSPFLKHYTEPLQSAPESTLPPGRRERTVSNPNRSASTQNSIQTLSQEDNNVRDRFRRPVSQSSLPSSVPRAAAVPMKFPELRTKTSEGGLRKVELRPKTPENSYRTPDDYSRSPDLQRDSGSIMGNSPSPQTGPSFSTPRSLSTSASPRKSPVTSHSLARPIQPDPRFSPLAPLLSASQNPSPAFLRPSPQKDPTPSLSRLQGRGFVQNMVKVSSQMESMATGSTGSPTSSDKSRLSNTKKPSVLDRWPAGSPKQDVSSTSVVSKAIPSPNLNVRPVVSSLPFPSPPGPISKKEVTQPDFRKFLKPASSLPTIPKAETVPPPPPKHTTAEKRKSFAGQMPPEGSPGLGSSSTLVSYIKPLKTGDDPLIMPESTPSLETHELGMKSTSSRAKPSHPTSKPAAAREQSAPSGKPLSHPTRDRVRKPRKVRDGQGSSENQEDAVEAKLDVVEVSSESARGQASFTSTSPLIAPAVSKAPKLQEQPSIRRHNLPEQGGHIRDGWTDRVIIGVKPVSSPVDAVPGPLTKQKTAMLSRVALPGLVPEGSLSKDANRPAVRQQPPSLQQLPYTKSESTDMVPPSRERSSSNPDTNSRPNNLNTDQFTSISLSVITTSAKSPTISLPSSPREDRSQVITARHTRTPSSGTRATAMDVAQALNNQPLSSPGWREHRADSSPREEKSSDANGSKVEEIAKASMPNRRSNVTSTLQAEKRKSSYEKYSAIMLPPLKEETTPMTSPAGTLTRTTVPPVPEAADQQISTEEAERKLEQVLQPGSAALSVVCQESGNMMYFNHVDKPLPSADIDRILESKSNIQLLNPEEVTISVEVMVIIGNTATALRRDMAIFYDSEVLAIIHRSKSKSSGLVSTSVCGWWGRRRQVNDKEQQKLQELAKRYGTVLETVLQCSEPLELVRILGGQLAIRQGSRAHWSPENTAMHLVRQSGSMILIDEHDLSIRNLCSGFSYCISILETIYVWHGRGSTTQERQAALAYARGLAPNADSITQLTEGENDSDEMFWMILGSDNYAKADYWQWRPSSSEIDPHLWRIEIVNNRAVVSTVSSLSREVDFQTSVYVVDCIWEFFVLVAKDARGKRPEIQLAVSITTRLSDRVAASRPYRPTVHVLVLPSQLPLEFQLSFRDIDEALLNDGPVPEHMNLLSFSDALQHLRRNSWIKDALKDDTMLPLGLHSADV